MSSPASSADQYAASAVVVTPSTILKHVVDTYKSAIITDSCIEQDTEVCDPLLFEQRLYATLVELRRKECRGVWLKVPPAKVDLVPVAIRLGFEYHSARPESVMLTAWLPRSEPSKLPPAAAHFIGVGSFVLNSRDELLVVKERTGPSATMKDFWKLPGGIVDRQEDVHKACVREVREECGIETEFVAVACIQEVHHGEARAGPSRSGTTDLYIVCVLKPSDESQPLVPCPDEIAEAKWMKAKDVLNLPFYAQQGSVFSHMFHHAYEVATGRVPGLGHERMKMGFLPMENNVFFVRPAKL